jgi:predicted metallopeptidase
MKECDFRESQELKELAMRVIRKRPEVCHIDADDVLFLQEYETKPPASARCFRLIGHPIQAFRTEPFCIVFYEAVIDHMSPQQRALLMLHELMHIPETGDKLIDHTIKDFGEIIGVGGADWSRPNKDVPDILED